MIPISTDFSGGGYRDSDGNWIRTKFCFMYCGPDRCDCCDPLLKHLRWDLNKKEPNDKNNKNNTID